MYKILIVDDMVLIRKGLQKMIKWQDLDVELIGEAENGVQALEMIKEHGPNIVITDIRMPKTNGIDLIKNINCNYPNIMTIVISGYDDFQYAQQAIKNGSLDYILKPINPSELNASIEKACMILDKNDVDEDKNLKSYLLKLIHNIEGSERYNEDDLFNHNPKEYLFSIVALYDKYSSIHLKELYERLKGLDKFLDVLLIDDTNENLFVFYTEYGYKIESFESKVYSHIEAIMNDYSSDKKVIFGIGKPSLGLEGINESYKTARELMLYGLLEKSTSIIRYFDLTKRRSVNISIEDYEDELLINITSGNLQEVTKILEKIHKDILGIENVSINSIRLFLSNLCHIILRVDSGLSNEIQDFLIKINNLYYFLSFDSLENVMQILNNLFFYTTKKYMKKNNKKETIILDIKEFIEKNYANDTIGLSQISELYHMNSSYLSNLFKKETGENINQYITKTRINNAKKILLQPDVNIKELAYLVGYSDYTYFYKVFKKMTGSTPKQYYLKHNKDNDN